MGLPPGACLLGASGRAAGVQRVGDTLYFAADERWSCSMCPAGSADRHGLGPPPLVGYALTCAQQDTCPLFAVTRNDPPEGAAARAEVGASLVDPEPSIRAQGGPMTDEVRDRIERALAEWQLPLRPPLHEAEIRALATKIVRGLELEPVGHFRWVEWQDEGTGEWHRHWQQTYEHDMRLGVKPIPGYVFGKGGHR